MQAQFCHNALQRCAAALRYGNEGFDALDIACFQLLELLERPLIFSEFVFGQGPALALPT
jgi:hypothetical protein